MLQVVREIVKLILTLVGWAFPLVYAYVNQSAKFLWLFILSAFLTAGLWNHYEILERIDMSKESGGKEVSDAE